MVEEKNIESNRLILRPTASSIRRTTTAAIMGRIAECVWRRRVLSFCLGWGIHETMDRRVASIEYIYTVVLKQRPSFPHAQLLPAASCLRRSTSALSLGYVRRRLPRSIAHDTRSCAHTASQPARQGGRSVCLINKIMGPSSPPSSSSLAAALQAGQHFLWTQDTRALLATSTAMIAYVELMKVRAVSACVSTKKNGRGGRAGSKWCLVDWRSIYCRWSMSSRLRRSMRRTEPHPSLSPSIPLQLLAARRVCASITARKLMHLGCGPIFLLCWPLFSTAPGAAAHAAAAPLAITSFFVLVGLGLVKVRALLGGRIARHFQQHRWW